MLSPHFKFVVFILRSMPFLFSRFETSQLQQFYCLSLLSHWNYPCIQSDLFYKDLCLNVEDEHIYEDVYA